MAEATKSFSIRVKVKTLEKIEDEANEKDRSVNYIISKILDNHVNEKEGV